MTIILQSDWVRRYAARLVESGAMLQKPADEAAADALARGDADMFNTPEEAVDDELSHWTDDEGAID